MTGRPSPPQEPDAGVIVGIDLGTTNSLVAVCDEVGPRVLPDEQGRALLPSVVRYLAGAVEVGHDARARASEFPRETITSVKRLMGRSPADAAADIPYLTYHVEPGERGTSRIVVPGLARARSPEEVSADILVRLREQAQRALGVPVTKAVVTVPAYFDDAQRQATRVAARLAGLDAVRLVPEPTAAALAYGLGLRGTAPRHVVVYDLGGGTFDVSLLRVTPTPPGSDEPCFFQVLAVGGDTRLGGDDVDHLLMDLLAREVRAFIGAGPDAPLDAGLRRSLATLAERVKVRLSEREAEEVRIDVGGGRAWTRIVTRSELEALAAPLVERTIEGCRRVMESGERALAGSAIDAVVLVGGSTRIPLVRRRAGEFFGMEPYTALDPDQVVALGAAVQARILSGASRDALLLDVLPLSLGIETSGGAVAKIISRHSTVPARAREHFSTGVDGQTSIRLSVYQGEREMAADCRKLGEFHLRGLPPMPAGVPQVQVEFLVDANGVLRVSAVERRSGRAATLQVIPNHGLTGEEVERIERESLTHARDDMTRHRVADLIAASELDATWIGSALSRHGGALTPEVRGDLEKRLASLREMIARARGDWRAVDPASFQGAKESLDRASIPLQEAAITASLRDEPRP